MRKTISLPHLNYTVYVRPMKRHPSGGDAVAWTHRADRWHSTIYLPDKPPPGLVAHEVTHVLQHLCAVRDMDFTHEDEHMGYIAQYLVGRILGYVWSRKKPRK